MITTITQNILLGLFIMANSYIVKGTVVGIIICAGIYGADKLYGRCKEAEKRKAELRKVRREFRIKQIKRRNQLIHDITYNIYRDDYSKDIVCDR